MYANVSVTFRQLNQVANSKRFPGGPGSSTQLRKASQVATIYTLCTSLYTFVLHPVRLIDGFASSASLILCTIGTKRNFKAGCSRNLCEHHAHVSWFSVSHGPDRLEITNNFKTRAKRKVHPWRLSGWDKMQCAHSHHLRQVNWSLFNKRPKKGCKHQPWRSLWRRNRTSWRRPAPGILNTTWWIHRDFQVSMWGTGTWYLDASPLTILHI